MKLKTGCELRAVCALSEYSSHLCGDVAGIKAASKTAKHLIGFRVGLGRRHARIAVEKTGGTLQAEFALDLSPDLDVFRHALEWLRDREGYQCDLVVHLRPTAPVRRVALIDEAIETMSRHRDAHSLRSVSRPALSAWTGMSEGALVPSCGSESTSRDRPTPDGLDNVHVAPLLCAGIIGFRSLRVAGVAPGERVGLFGFGSSASLAIAVLQSWKCEVYVSTRGENHRKSATSLGATWVGKEDEIPPVKLDRAITFAPSGKVVIHALSTLRKGGVVAINAIHLDQMPAFDYDQLLWGERQIRSVANMTRQDARDFLAIASQLKIQPQVTAFPLAKANRALLAVKDETERGSAVIVP